MKLQTEIEIRPATSSDVSAIGIIGKTSFIESHGHSASLKDINCYIETVYDENTVLSELNDPSNMYHLLFYQSKLAGYSKIKLNTACDWVQIRAIAKLDRLYLLQSYYGQKLGYQLMDYNLQLARKGQQKGIWLFTWIENHRAISFYNKFGFKIVGKADFRISENHVNPNHIMFLNLINA
ncbi:MAG: GNAT family N-acetyltransferase [Saprospiraceae bacterium]